MVSFTIVEELNSQLSLISYSAIVIIVHLKITDLFQFQKNLSQSYRTFQVICYVIYNVKRYTFILFLQLELIIRLLIMSSNDKYTVYFKRWLQLQQQNNCIYPILYCVFIIFSHYFKFLAIFQQCFCVCETQFL